MGNVECNASALACCSTLPDGVSRVVSHSSASLWWRDQARRAPQVELSEASRRRKESSSVPDSVGELVLESSLSPNSEP